MRSAAHHLSISTARAEALFASALQRSDDPSAAQVQQAIAAAVRAFGTRGCAARVAQAYGEHPETAVPRMRWARTEIPNRRKRRDGGKPDGWRHDQPRSPGAGRR